MERVILAGNAGASSMETSKLYWEGDNMRVERYTTAGLLVRIKKGQTLYIYVPAEKKAVKTVIPAGHAETVQKMLEEMTGPITGGNKLGTARVAGVNCNVFAVSVKGRTAKAYVSTDARLPVLLKIQEASGTASRTIETRRVKLNYNVPDTMFSLPKGTTVKEEKFPTVPKQSPSGGKG